MVVLVPLGAPSGLSAQAVLGTVVEAGGDQVVAGVRVTLFDEDGARVVTAMSDARGRVVLRARSPGLHTLRAERIGFRSVEIPGLSLRAGETLEQRIEVPVEVIALEGLVVEADRRCVLRPEEGERTAALWEEARKALAEVEESDRQGLFRYRVEQYERSLDPSTLEVRQERTSALSWLADVPYESLPPEDLVERGFIQDRDDGSYYYAPDAGVLLSEAFLDAYCFRAVPGPEEAPNLVGLAFEPVSGRRNPDIQGTLWLDSRSGHLRFAEFRYLRGPGPDDQRIGGRVEFTQLPTGAWIVDRWWIRMPEVAVRTRWHRTTGTRMDQTIGGIAETGAEVITVLDERGRRLDGSMGGAVEGVVHDPVAGEPLTGATVRLVGTVHAVRTDQDGRFQMDGLLEGRYLVSFQHPDLAAFGFFPEPVPVQVSRGETAEVALRAPDLDARIRAACPGEAGRAMAAEPGLILGTVLDPATGEPSPHARVRAEWTRYLEVDPVAERIQGQVMRADAVADGAGRYRLCGVPRGHPVQVRVTPAEGGREGRAREVRVHPAEGILRLDLRPDP
jgi:hypothetical protein